MNFTTENIPMSEIERLILKDGDDIFDIYVESKNSAKIPASIEPLKREDSEYESYGPKEDMIVHINKVHGIIRAYARYAIGAFKNLGGAEVEEITLKFGLKIGGKTGIPILTEGSAESNFEIQVKCKFSNSSDLQS